MRSPARTLVLPATGISRRSATLRLVRAGRELNAGLQRRWRQVGRVLALLRRAGGITTTAATAVVLLRRAGRSTAATAVVLLRGAACITTTAVALLALGATPTTAGADERIAVTSAQLELRGDIDPGLFLEAQFDFELPPTLEDAVNRGVALYFVVDFEMYRERWYWFDRRVLAAQLSYRLSYSPLTRQYRLARGSLAQPFETIAEALATIRSVRSWKLAERGIVQPGNDYNAQVRLRLDTSLLPKPFQVNALTNRDWTLASDWRKVAMPIAAESVH